MSRSATHKGRSVLRKRMGAPEFRALSQYRVAKPLKWAALATRLGSQLHFRFEFSRTTLFLSLPLAVSLSRSHFSLTSSYSMQKVPHKSSHSYAAAARKSTRRFNPKVRSIHCAYWSRMFASSTLRMYLMVSFCHNTAPTFCHIILYMRNIGLPQLLHH